jgi:Animal haem peroxidase
MLAEPYGAGSEFGELQAAIWKRQFEALRDGDRFFYRNDPGLVAIAKLFGTTYRHGLSEIIAMNTNLSGDQIQADAFRISSAAQDEVRKAASQCPAPHAARAGEPSGCACGRKRQPAA